MAVSALLVTFVALHAEPPETNADASDRLSFTSSALKQLPQTLKNDPERLQQLNAILKEAERIRDLPLVQRAASLKDLENPQGRRIGGIDKRTYQVQKASPEKAGIFAIASSDLDITAMIGRELPLLAAAYLITDDKSFLDRIIAQLRETVQWDPLQRPGWELYTASHSLPPDGNDGVWLATGQGLAAIWQTLDLLPEGALPDDLMSQIHTLLKREVARITRDWTDKKMWFVKNNVPTTNQWIVPAAGQAMACAILGKDADPVSYDLAVNNLLLSVAGLGEDGSTSEGTEYSQHWTAPFLYMAAQALHKTGDDRLASRAFFQNFPAWLALRYQPGGWMINASDNWGGARGLYYRNAPDFTRLVVLTNNGSLAWMRRNVLKVFPYDYYGLASLAIPEDRIVPPPKLWALYERQHMAVWRNNWDENGSGVWVRGGDPRDGHDHYDRGHVNFISEGKAVLIEGGTPGYDDPRKREKFDSVVGHNVLQVGDNILPAKTKAPISVAKMDETGGDVTVDAGAGYPTVKQWTRRVQWTARSMEIVDTVVLAKPDVVLFRWHLASEQSLAISSSSPTESSADLPGAAIAYSPKPDKLDFESDWVPAAQNSMSTPAASIAVQADQDIVCSQEKNLDHVFFFRNPNHTHTTLVVKSARPVTALTVKTSISVR